MDRFNSAIQPLWTFLHNGHIIRRAVLFIAVWMTLDSYEWVKVYGSSDDANQWVVASVIGIPSALLAAAIKFYSAGRKHHDTN